MDMWMASVQEALGIGYDILVYGIGIVAMVFSIIAVQFKRRVTIVFCNFLGQAAWVAYFLLQSDMVSAIACALSAIMLAAFARKDRWPWATSPVCVISFAVVIAGFSLLSAQSWIDAFPLLAGVFAVIANSRSEEKRVRQFSLLWFAFWLVNSTLRWYPVAFINDFLCTVSAVVALVRYRERRPTGADEN